MGGRILIVEDEEKLASLLSDYLAAAGFEPSLLNNGTDVVPRVREHAPDLVLLDLMLPGRSGLEVCKELRTFSSVPVIMVTAKIEEIDRLLGLELGADDYICKPFSPREVVARVRAVLRRTREGQVARSEELTLDGQRYKAIFRKRDLGLTAVEFKLLQLLAGSPGRIYSREQIMSHIYPDDRFVSDRTIDSHIKKLRKKIEEIAPDADLIRSVYGAGYKYEP